MFALEGSKPGFGEKQNLKSGFPQVSLVTGVVVVVVGVGLLFAAAPISQTDRPTAKRYKVPTWASSQNNGNEHSTSFQI